MNRGIVNDSLIYYEYIRFNPTILTFSLLDFSFISKNCQSILMACLLSDSEDFLT